MMIAMKREGPLACPSQQRHLGKAGFQPCGAGRTIMNLSIVAASGTQQCPARPSRSSRLGCSSPWVANRTSCGVILRYSDAELQYQNLEGIRTKEGLLALRQSCIVPLELTILASTASVLFPGYLLASCRPELLLRPDRRVPGRGDSSTLTMIIECNCY